MRFIVMHKVDAKMEAGAKPSQQIISEMGALVQSSLKKGEFLNGAGLHGSAQRVRLRAKGGETTITEGPYAGENELIASFNAGNSLVAAGALESESGRFAVKVPALIETAEDILNFPIAVSGNAAVTLGDVAEVRPTFKDPTSISRINGKPAITVEVSKRTGANLIETVDATRKVMEELRKTWPSTVQVTYTQDKSKDIRIMLHELRRIKAQQR